MIKKLPILVFFVCNVILSQQRAIEAPPIDIFTCDPDNDGFTIHNLTVNDDVVTGTQDPANLNITYYESLTDATNAINSIADPENYSNFSINPTIWIRVEDLSDGSSEIDSFTVNTVNTPYVDLSSEGGDICVDDSGDILVPVMLDGTPVDVIAGATYAYSWTFNGTQVATVPTIIVDQVGIYALTSMATYSTTSGDVTCEFMTSVEYFEATMPAVVNPADKELCDTNNDGIAEFVLSESNDEITGGDPDLTIEYYLTLQDAEIGDPSLALNQFSYTNVDPYIQMIWARVENTAGCLSIVSLNLIVLDSPTPNDMPANFMSCDVNGDGLEVFDLTSQNSEILGGLDDTTFSVTWFTTEDNAINEVVDIPDPTNYVSSSSIVYARVTNETQSATTRCFVIVVQELTVNELPIIAPPNNLTECDDDGDSSAIFDLTQNDSVVIGSQNPVDFDINYFETLADAESNVNEILPATAYTNITNPQVIHVRVESLITGCSEISSFDIEAIDCDNDDDGDGVPNEEEDLNNNGNLDDDDTDGDMIPNYQDNDDDGDTVLTKDEIEGIGAGRSAFIDTDTDTVENYLDNDDDGDGILTKDEDYNGNGNPIDDDTNNNGIPDFLDEDVALGIESSELLNVQIYPNPTTDIVHISSSTAFEKMTLYTINGALIQTIETAPQLENMMDLSSLPNGIYFLNLDGKKTLKIIRL